MSPQRRLMVLRELTDDSSRVGVLWNACGRASLTWHHTEAADIAVMSESDLHDFQGLTALEHIASWWEAIDQPAR